MMRVVGSTSSDDATTAMRLSELEAQIVVQQAALDAERERRIAAEVERDRLREAYEALKVQAELAHRRLVIAKAERVDTTQFELDFAATLAELDKHAGLDPNADDPLGDGGSNRPVTETRGRRRRAEAAAFRGDWLAKSASRSRIQSARVPWIVSAVSKRARGSCGGAAAWFASFSSA
ncbi:MAG: hypothetical protein ACKV2T_42075 [Kofleriaceae bacterium]